MRIESFRESALIKLIVEQKTNPTAFIAERAWTDLKILNDMGPRVSGSYNNEVLAVNFLKREIVFIQQTAHKNQKVYADVQIVSGGYWLGFKPQGKSTLKIKCKSNLTLEIV